MSLTNEQRLRHFFDALTIHSDSTVLIADQAVENHQRGSLVETLTWLLYEQCYARLFNGDLQPRLETYPPDSRFIHQLSQANASRSGWDFGWRLTGRDVDGGIHLEKGSRRRVVPAEQEPLAYSTSPDYRCLPLPRDSVKDGFYFAFGDTLPDAADLESVARIYFHADAGAATQLLQEVSQRLNHYDVPFCFKCPAATIGFDRIDACVLYLARRYVRFGFRLLLPLDELWSRLAAPVPLFTQQVLPGIGVADDPGNGESLGQHRCRIAADAIVRAFHVNEHSTDERLKHVQESFREEGLDWSRAHLRPNTTDFAVELLEDVEDGNRVDTRTAVAGPPHPGGNTLLDSAARIGNDLMREAIWHADQCNWVGTVWRRSNDDQVSITAAHGCGLAEGTAGIGLFLACLASHTSHAAYRHTALAALRQAETSAAACPWDFEHGALGVAWAMVHAGQCLQMESLVTRGRRILDSLPMDSERHRLAISALLRLAIQLEDGQLTDRVVELSHRRLEEKQNAGSTSAPISSDDFLEELGLAESWYVTQTESLFRARQLHSSTSTVAPPGTTTDVWRNGLLWMSAQVAAEAPIDNVNPPSPTGLDYSLANGVAGHSEWLLAMSVLQNDPTMASRAHTLFTNGIQQFERFRLPWPCRGGCDRDVMNLWDGISGIGYAMLRVHDPSVPACWITPLSTELRGCLARTP